MPSSLNTDCLRCREHPGTEEIAPALAPRSPEEPEIGLGQVLGGSWRLVSILGEGGMGSVFLADDLGLDRRVAIKLLGRGLIDDERSRSRFEREAKLTAKLEHPNIVPVYATGSHEGRPFIVMKHVIGRPLHQLLKERVTPWDWPSTRAIIAQLLEGLGFVHSRGLVHRDVKPSNVIIGPTGTVTLLDFGLIKPVAQEATVPGQVMGTWRYMAPEQMLGDEAPDARADLYAVGVIAFQMLCGAMPFTGDNYAVAKQKLDHHAVDPRRLNPSLPPPVCEALLRAIHPDREQRCPTASELLEDLDRAWAQLVPPRRVTWPWVIVGLALFIAPMLVVFGTRERPVAGSALPASEAVVPSAVVPLDPPEPVTRNDGGLDAGRDSLLPTDPASEREDAGLRLLSRPAKHDKPARGRVRVSIVTRVDGVPNFAAIEVDGVAMGDAPVQLELAPGKHRLRVTRAGFKDVDRSVVVQSGRIERVVVDLQR